jgi:hypothetical protein
VTASLFENGNAIIIGEHRYSLSRRWGDGWRALFIMLNPSTADAQVNDPTIRRCIGFARSWGAGALDVANLFALRSTDPEALLDHPEPVGEKNDEFIVDLAARAGVTVCAWGSHKAVRRRAPVVLELLRDAGHRPMCLRVTKDGHPSHPLYLPADLRPIPYGVGK